MHKRLLLELLKAIDDSEAHSRAAIENGKPFISETSLKSVLVTLNSAFELVEFLHEKCHYDFVLTSKFIQDCIEVIKFLLFNSSLLVMKFLIIWRRFFGIVRACGNGHDAPTETPFLPSVYTPVRNALKIDGNVDDEERMHLLASYKDCIC
jgi:hypothetical protein